MLYPTARVRQNLSAACSITLSFMALMAALSCSSSDGVLDTSPASDTPSSSMDGGQDVVRVADGLPVTDTMDDSWTSYESDQGTGNDAMDVSEATDTPESVDASEVVGDSDDTAGSDGSDRLVDAVYGGVLITQVEDPNLQIAAVTANFTNTPPVDVIKITEGGACYAYKPTEAALVPNGLSIGDIEFSGLSQPLTMSPQLSDADGYFYDSGLPEDTATILGSSQAITVNASGGVDLNGVSVSLAVPKPVSVSAPVSDVNKEQPLSVTWVSEPSEDVSIRLDLAIFGADGNPKSGNLITCDLNSDTGTYVISPALLAELPISSGGILDLNVLVVGITRIASQLVDVDGPSGFGSVVFAVTRTAGAGVLVE